MYVSEQKLLDGLQGFTNGGHSISIVEGVIICWAYCLSEGAVRLDRDDADKISYICDFFESTCADVKLAKRLNKAQKKAAQQIKDQYK